MGSRTRTVRVAVGVSLAVIAGALGAAGASGFFTAQATVAGTTFQSDTVISQAQPACTNEGGVLGLLGYAELTWSHVDARYEYSYQVVRVTNGAVEASGVLTPTVPAGDPVTLEIRSSLITSDLVGQNFDVVVTARLRDTPWTAATSTTTRVHGVNILLIGLSMRCGST